MRDTRHAAWGPRPERRRPCAVEETGTLAYHRAGADLGDLPIVDLDHEDPVEDQVDLGAALTLANQVGALGDGLDLRLGAAAHDRARQRSLERRLDRGHHGR